MSDGFDFVGPPPTLEYIEPTFSEIEQMAAWVSLHGGGRYRDGCRPHTITYPATEGHARAQASTCACGVDALMGLPYVGEDGEDSRALARVCLVCDGGKYMPVTAEGLQ